jgi:hypothetical protein
MTAPEGFSTDPGFVFTASGGNGGSPNGLLGGSSGLFVGLLPTPAATSIEGCIDVSGMPLTGATVKLKQKKVHLQTVTDSEGCYAFSSGVSSRKGTITIELPSFP